MKRTIQIHNDGIRTTEEIKKIMTSHYSEFTVKPSTQSTEERLIIESHRSSIFVNCVITKFTSLIFFTMSFPSEINRYITELFFKLKRPYYIFNIEIGSKDKKIRRSFKFPVESKVKDVYSELSKWNWFNYQTDFIHVGRNENNLKKKREIFCDEERTLISYTKFRATEINYLFIRSTTNHIISK